MHLGNGAVTPACAMMGMAAAGVGLVAAGAMLRRGGLDPARLRTAGALGAAIFAAQAVNVAILPFASAHLVGGLILAWVLGAPLGILVMSMVLLVQALLLGDGGLMALGVNLCNMAILPALLAAWARRLGGPAPPTSRQAVLAGLAGAVAVLGAAMLIPLQVALFRGEQPLAGWSAFAWQMIWTHALIGLAEGMLTVAVLALLGGLSRPGALAQARFRIVAAVGLAGAVLALPWASTLPDGYEAAIEHSGMAQTVESLTSLGHTLTNLQEGIVAAMPESPWLMLTTGALLTGACLAGLGQLFPRRAPLLAS